MSGTIDPSYAQTHTEWLSEDPVLNGLEHEPLTVAQGRKLMMGMLEVNRCVHVGMPIFRVVWVFFPICDFYILVIILGLDSPVMITY